MSFLFNRNSQMNESSEVAQQELDLAFKIAKQEKRKAILRGEAGKFKQSFTSAEARGALGENIGTAVAAGLRQRPSFTREQEMLGQMFGQGEKIWGINNEPVRINNDLNSSRSDPWDETSSMFGTGPFSERSGLF